MRLKCYVWMALLIAVGAAVSCRPSPTPPPTATALPAPTATVTLAPTATPEPTATATPTSTPQVPTSAPAATPTSIPAATPTSAPTATPVAVADARGPGFADYRAREVALPAAYKGYALPLDLAAVDGVGALGFGEAQRAQLAEHGFVVTPAEWAEFYQLYDRVRYDDMPVFVTTDSVFHIYHLIFDKMLRDLERAHFEPDIRALTAACLQAAQAIYAEQRGTSLEEVARGVVAYFAVADALIDPEAVPPPEVADLVAGELALIEAHAGLGPSAIFSEGCPAGCDPCDTDPPPECVDKACMCEDYSQYVPRGHYTRSEQLQRYFRTMMWYGRINMRLQRPSETRMALLITYLLRHTDVNGEPAATVWARVYDPTVFIVGKADDLGFHEYGALWDEVYGADAPLSDIADEAKLAAFVEAARQLPPPQINSMFVYIWEDKEQVTQGFRTMGQRFVLDAYIFEELTWREVGTLENPRWLPKGLDVMAALGSEEAYALLDEMGETSYAHYPEQMAKLRGEIGALQLDSWTQNLYWAWLYAFDPLLSAKGAQYPAFMRSEAWARKDLQTALGSWTELKHDTILYAKQVMAEMGGGWPEELPSGWVEPNPEVYARLLALADMTRRGLASRDLLTENTRANLQRLSDLLAFLLDVAQRELAGAPLDEDDYYRIDYYGGELEAMTLAAADLEGEGRPYFEEQEPAALVADVATDPNGEVLEEAIGYVHEIHVVVPDAKGALHVARGGVFSYYEFTWPMGDRLTDEAWQAMLAAGEAPAQPAWTERFR
ncbi:MAG: DUF3160 domain-containing protein [Anaerolineae bacterium]|nr:DUF3160 domain-containing protein [Anaerolineae bacterium]